MVCVSGFLSPVAGFCSRNDLLIIQLVYDLALGAISKARGTKPFWFACTVCSKDGP
ncbi:hypothetical protein ANAPRD1_00529 [Anaplasma phagocytophilum]|nr:hypothetical protein ANAPRD1_00529 [Anaplasma phagocytophilum]SCV64435.1 hypothetical protein ANAPH1_00598 [Anaplasma phagocytophilum]SCV64862.1 hypothetical protein ANAPH2_01093 [Anaplasma phagocytophilum]